MIETIIGLLFVGSILLVLAFVIPIIFYIGSLIAENSVIARVVGMYCRYMDYWFDKAEK